MAHMKNSKSKTSQIEDPEGPATGGMGPARGFRQLRGGFALVSVLLLATIIFFAGLFLTTAAERHYHSINYHVNKTEAYYRSMTGLYDAMTKLRANPPTSFPYEYQVTENGKLIKVTIYDMGDGTYRIRSESSY